MQYLRLRNLIFFFLIILLFVNIVLFFYYQFLKRGESISIFPKSQSKPGSCLVFEEKYCRKGVKLNYNNKFAAVGFNLPKDALIFSPIDGNLTSTKMVVKKGQKNYDYSGLRVVNPNTRSVELNKNRNFFVILNKDSLDSDEIKVIRGQIIEKIGNRFIDYFGNYNVLVYFSAKNEKGLLQVDEKFTLELFGL